MNVLNKTIIALLVCIASSLHAGYKLEDLKDHATETPENIARPNCLQFQQDCRGSVVDKKKRGAYEHCIEKKLTNHCKENFALETQKGLYSSCINTQCGQQSIGVKDPADVLDQELKEEIVAERNPAKIARPRIVDSPRIQRTTETSAEPLLKNKPENKVIVKEKDTEIGDRQDTPGALPTVSDSPVAKELYELPSENQNDNKKIIL